MPAKRTNVSPDVEKFASVLVKALARQTRDWAKVKWPPALKEFVTEHVARHKKKPDLSRQGVAREALDPVCDVLAELVRGASTESEIQLWVTMWCFYGDSIRRGISVPENNEVRFAIGNKNDVDRLLGDIELPIDRVDSFREAIRRLVSSLSLASWKGLLTASKNTGLTRWYAAICARVAPRQRFGSLPAVPPDYIDRPNEMAQLDRLIENGGGGLASLEGAIGVGKSTLAGAWARKHQLKGTFPLGIDWLKAGRFEDRAFWLHACLGVPGDEAFGSWLQQRHRLLILDDVQDEQTIEWLTKFGDIVATVLITTEFSAWLDGRCSSQRRILMRGMTPDKGRALLAVSAHLPHSGDNPDDLVAMNKIGELLTWRPIYLKLVASRARSTSLADALALLRERLNRPLHPQESGLDRVIEELLSLIYERLTAEEQARFRQLACLGQVSSFDTGAVQLVWKCANDQAVEWLGDLVGRNLISKTTEPNYPECGVPRYSLDRIYWRFAQYKREEKGDTCPKIRYEDYSGLWFKLNVWWWPTMRSGNDWWQSQKSLTQWAFDKTVIPDAPWWKRLTLRNHELFLFSRHLSNSSITLPFEAAATAECLRRKSEFFLNRKSRTIMVMLMVILIVTIVLLVLLRFPASIAFGLAIFLVLLFPSAPFFIHQVNYYRFLKRWLP